MIKLFLITGACASGKSHYVEVLKKEFKNSKVKIHDFDEKMKLPLDEAVDYFLNLSIDYNTEGYYLIICGGITPQDVKKSKIFTKNFKLYTCLLNVDPIERADRLFKRADNFFNAINPNLSKEELVKCVIESAENYKFLLKLSDEYTEVDNTQNNSSKTSEAICCWLNKNMEQV